MNDFRRTSNVYHRQPQTATGSRGGVRLWDYWPELAGSPVLLMGLWWAAQWRTEEHWKGEVGCADDEPINLRR